MAVTKQNTTAGNLLVLAVAFSASAPTSVSGGFLLATSASNTDGVALYYLLSGPGGNVTVTVSFGSAQAVSLLLGEAQGHYSLDTFTSQSQSSVTQFSTALITPQFGALEIAVHTHGTTNVTGVPAIFTPVIVTETAATGVQPLAVEYVFLSGADPVQGIFNVLNSDSGSTLIVSFKPATIALQASVNDYLGLVTSEHNKRPNFMAMIAAVVQGHVDNINLLKNFVNLFDIDQAVGQQLDFIGQWVGVSRNITIPLTGVYFAFDTTGVGFDQGTWFGPGSSSTGLTVLADSDYRILLKAKIAANHWDGTVPGAYAIWSIVFALEGFNILIQDGQDMSMAFILLNTTVSAVALALLVNGYIALKPAGVHITGYWQPSTSGPMFGFDATSSLIAGFDSGAWAKQLG